MSEPALSFISEPRLADVAVAATPAWAWRPDAEGVLWANAAGAALLGAPTVASLQARIFACTHPVASQVARLAELLPSDGTPRLERLRGLAPGIGRLLTCSCARVTLDGEPAILITATEAAGTALSVGERVRRLLDGCAGALAAFSPEGKLLFAAPAARQRLTEGTTLAALGAEALAASALAEGQASGRSSLGRLALRRLGSQSAAVLVATFEAETAPAAPPAEPGVAPAEPEPAAREGESETAAADAKPEAPSTGREEPVTQTAPETAAEPEPEAAAAAGDSDAAVAPDATTAVYVAPATAAAEAEPQPVAEAPLTPAVPMAASDAAGPAAAAPSAVETSASRPVAEATAETPPAPALETPPRSPAPLPPLAERRHPLRFVWQIDAGQRLTVASEEFIALMGPAIASRLDRPWAEVTDELGLDPTGRLAAALAARDTFSGVAAAWPIEGSESLAAELSGLPLFDRDRKFAGYRGFGVCRDIARLNAIAGERREAAAAARQAAAAAEPPPPAAAPPEQSAEPSREAARPIEPMAAAAPGSGPEASAAAMPPEPPAASPEAAPDTDARTETVAEPVITEETQTGAIADQTSDADTTAEATTAGAITASETTPTEPATDQPIPPLPPGERPLFTVVPASKNVVPFRAALPIPADKRPGLTSVERSAFQEIAKALGARVEGEAEEDTAVQPAPEPDEEAGNADEPAPAKRDPALHRVWPRPIPSAYAAGRSPAARVAASPNGERAVLDRLPVGVLVYRGDALLHANRALLDWTGYEDLDAVAAAGGLERLFDEPGLALLGEPGGSGQRLAITTRRGESLPVECRLFTVSWHDATALMIVLQRAEAEERVRAAQQAVLAADERTRAAQGAHDAAEERLRQTELALRAAESARRELESILETATDGVLVVDRDGIIMSHNRSVEALFGLSAHEFTNRSFVDLFAPESHRTAQEYLNGLIRNGVASVLNDGREVIGRVREGGLMPLFMTIGRIADDRFCVVFRDITQWKRAEEDLTNAKREAEKASSAKSDFLAKVSHEIRTPLNAIIGFAEVMMEQRFGPVGNERYLQYLKDIRTSGEHVISLVNDLLDLSKIEAGKLELNFASVALSEVVNQCVAIMQPQANRERIIIRTSLMPTLPPVVADERSMRQIVLNLLSNSIKFTGAGGQVIVSTALTDQGEAILRVRDTGIGMSEKEIATAMEPFRQVVSSGRSDIGTGLGLPLTKALAEANRATFTIKSAVDAGTLVEICFPATRVLAE